MWRTWLPIALALALVYIPLLISMTVRAGARTYFQEKETHLKSLHEKFKEDLDDFAIKLREKEDEG